MTTNQTADHAAWSELLGSENWDGLLDPLDLSLRTLILRCGNFCQATYDAFNNDQNSKYCCSSRYGKHSFFDKVMLQDAANYQVSCFLYASAQVNVPEALLLHPLSRDSWDRECNWIGYITVTFDQVSQAIGRREIYIIWRGTTCKRVGFNEFGSGSTQPIKLTGYPFHPLTFYFFIFYNISSNFFYICLLRRLPPPLLNRHILQGTHDVLHDGSLHLWALDRDRPETAGVHPHDQLLIRTGDSFFSLLLFAIGFLLSMVSFVKDRKFQSFFAKGCTLLHVFMVMWRCYFERLVDDLAWDWLRQMVDDVVLAAYWVYVKP